MLTRHLMEPNKYASWPVGVGGLWAPTWVHIQVTVTLLSFPSPTTYSLRQSFTEVSGPLIIIADRHWWTGKALLPYHANYVQITGDYWRLPETTGDYWRLLENNRDYCRLLEITGDYWDYWRSLENNRNFWRLLEITGDYYRYVTHTRVDDEHKLQNHKWLWSSSTGALRLWTRGRQCW